MWKLWVYRTLGPFSPCVAGKRLAAAAARLPRISAFAGGAAAAVGVVAYSCFCIVLLLLLLRLSTNHHRSSASHASLNTAAAANTAAAVAGSARDDAVVGYSQVARALPGAGGRQLGQVMEQQVSFIT